ncbi:MAG: hypothetical protein WCW77_00125 [Patescibacteria group bacterium]|jgi:hypothetical protein
MEKTKDINYGLVFEEVKEQDWVFGASPLQNKVIFADGHGWQKFICQSEIQFNRNFDSFSCVTYAILKALVMHIYCVYGILLDLDEMFTAVMSRTIPGVGNSVRNVMESLRLDGFVEEYIATKLRYAFDANTTKQMFFADQPYKLVQEALKSIIKWKINWEALTTSNNVPHSLIVGALKYSPVVITGRAWIKNDKTGLYVDEGLPANHAHLAVDYDSKNPDIIIDSDTYPKDFQYKENVTQDDLIKQLDPTYRIWSAHKITAEPIISSEPKNFLLNKIKDMLKNIIRCNKVTNSKLEIGAGSLWFTKDGKRQRFNKWSLDAITLMTVNFGVQQASDTEIAKFKETSEFFPAN